MLKMKLPMRTAEEGAEEAAEDEQEQEQQEQPDSGLHAPCPAAQAASSAAADSAGELRYPVQLDKETVFEWFGLHLDPAKRIEFMCGLLHMCQPLELRFLGSCLEDLARKDFHVLRDFEIRANSPSELGLLVDVTDPVVRSKLLVCLSLLGSENRECAGILFRILSHVDPALYFKTYDFPESPSCGEPHHLQLRPPCDDGVESGRSEPCAGPSDAGAGLLEQLALLFTMASLHPAFPFHQRESVRLQLDKVELAMDRERRNRHGRRRRRQQQQQPPPPPPHGTGGPNKAPKTDQLSASTDSSLKDRAQPHRSNQSPSRKSQKEAVYIEKIMLKGISWSRTEKEYSFEVKWSDSSSSSVTKTQHEMENFLLKLPKELSTESFEKAILRLLSQGESRELERTLKEKFLSAPQAFRQTRKVCAFFLPDSSGPNCSRCNPVPLGKNFQQDCSEVSSQDEGVYLEPYILGHRKKHGSKSPSLSSQSGKSCLVEGCRASSSELNGLPDWRRKSCPLKTILEPRAQGGEQRLGTDHWSSSPGNKSKARAPPTDREKGQASQSKPGCTANGVTRPQAVQMIRQPVRKDAQWDTGSGQDSCGETSSESYSSPSSPQHDGRESLESEDEKDHETDSHSDDCSKGKADCFSPCKAVSGSTVAAVHPLVPVSLKEEPSRTDSPLNTSTFPQIPFVHPLPFVVQNGACGPDVTGPLHGVDGKAAVGMMSVIPSVLREQVTTGGTNEAEKTPLLQETTSLQHSFSPSPLSLQQSGSPSLQPLIQRFKSATLQASSESCSTPAHQTPVGAISVISAGPAYMSSLQPAYPSSEPVMNSGLAHSVPLVEQHTKAAGLSLPAGLPPSYSMPVSTTVIPTVGAVSSSAMSQAQVIVPPAVPTHAPGPAPSPSPALTHSMAQSDSTSCGTSTGASTQQAQQQSSSPQQVGCGACGCRGTCGSNHAPSYYYPPQMPRQVLSIPQIFHLTSLAHQSSSATQLPFFPPTPSPYASGPLLHTHSEHVLGTQVGYGMQQMATFNRFYQPVFPQVSIMPSSTIGTGMKKNGGNISCYNCGISGHYAQDCKQPSIDATQQGGFRLKYVTSQSPETLDKAD